MQLVYLSMHCLPQATWRQLSSILWDTLLFVTTVLLGLKITLTESQETVALDINLCRHIKLVPGRSYEINCNHEGGFGGAQYAWFHSNSTPVQKVTNSDPVNMSSVHAIKVDANNWKLLIQEFRETAAGEVYTCRGANRNVTLVVGSGMCNIYYRTHVLVHSLTKIERK